MATVKMTINIDPELRRRLKIHAARLDTTVSKLLRAWIRKGLVEANMPPLATERPKADPPPVPLAGRK